MKRILILHAGGIGDFILSIPAIKALREAFPRARFALLGRNEFGFLVKGALRFEEIRDIRRADATSLFGDALDDALAGWLRSFDVAVCWLGGPDGVPARRLAHAGIGRVIAAEPFPPAGEITHAADHLLRTVRSLAVSSPLPPGEGQREGERRQTSATVKDLLVIHPGSGGRRKCWPADRFAEVARRAKGGREVCVLLGPAEDERAEVRNAFDDAEIVRGKTLEEIADLLRARAALYLGNDSGITHLAAHAGAPTVAVFGPTDPRIWAPRGPNVRIVEAPRGDLAALSVRTVLREVEKLNGH